jgi:hypothetical protein
LITHSIQHRAILFKKVEKACYQLLKKHYNFDEKKIPELNVIRMIKKLKISEHRSCISTNNKMKNITKELCTPETKVELLLNNFVLALANSVNLATIILKIGNLLDQAKNGRQLFTLHKDEIIEIFFKCKEKLHLKAFSLRGVSNLISGISKFYRHGYHPIMDILFQNLYSHLVIEKEDLSAKDILAILPAATRIYLNSNIISSQLQALLNFITYKWEDFIASKENLSLIGYSLVVLDNYQKNHSDFKLKINKILLEKACKYSLFTLNNSSLLIESRHQAYLACLYFKHYYPQFLQEPFNLSDAFYTELFASHAKNVKSSKLQKKIFNFISAYISCQSESVINSLPVDIVYQNYLIHVNGPHHYVFFEESEYELSPKDFLHITLLNCNLPDQVNSKYINILIDYHQYRLLGAQFIKDKLQANGLKLPNHYRNTNYFALKFQNKESNFTNPEQSGCIPIL